MRNDNRGVSKIIGVVILVVIVIMLSVGVLFTAQTLIGDQPQDMTAGTTDERVDFYTHEAQLVNQGNTDTVYAVSPLGTEYKLQDSGDLQKILPLKKGSHPDVSQYQIVGERDGQRQLLKTSHFEEGVRPDVVVHDDGDKDYETVQEAINNIDDDTERDISASNPGVIVVQKGVYNENIEVTSDITIIAEYGTVIQDANPNEDVVDIRGDNVRFQNFEVDGNPNPEDEQHYARHGIHVQGSDAVIQGNTIRRANSPDVTSSAVRINDANTLVRYNNMLNSQQSINFGQESVSPAVCGNQFENGIGGSVTSQTQKDVATLNHWNGGMPSNLARTVVAAEQSEDTESDDYTLPSDAPKDFLENTNSRVDPTILGEDAGRASLPFTGTKMGTSSTPGECELSIGLINDPEDGTSINIEEIQVTINGQTTTIEVVEEVNLGDGESSDTRDGPTATCDCGGDGNYDPGDRISISESSFGEIQTYTTEGTLEPLPFTEGEGSEPTPSSFNVQSSGGTSISTTSYSNPTPTNTEDESEPDTTQSNDEDTTEPDFRILLGSSVDINLADEVILEPVISGAESPQDEIEYEWTLGDGSESTDRVVRHVYDDPGTYTVELTVTDPATGETDTDSTTVTVEEGTKDVETIRSDEQQRLADLVEEDPDGDGKVLYLEEGTTYTTLSTISAQDLTIIGQGDDVTLDGPITVTSSGVTFKNVDIDGGLIVQNNDFKLYNSDISNANGYAVELNANGGGFQIGDSTLEGQNGVYVDVDDDVLLTGNTITATDQYGIYTGESISNVRVRDNTITSNDIGIYESLAVDSNYERNTINAPTTLEQQEATAPEVNEINVDFTTTDVPLALSTQVNDPDGYSIDEVTWDVNGDTFTKHPSENLIYTFDEPGEYTISVTVTDQFGKTTTESKTVTVDEFEATLTTSEEASIGDSVTASVDYNIPEDRIHSIEYEWGDGTSDVIGSSSDTHTYSSQGDYDISVTVNPDEGESRTVSDSITIVDSPVADFAIEDPLLAGEPIQFNGAYSTAPDGKNLEYQWEMGDGSTYTTESPQHTYSDTGTYDVTLTVSDGEYSDTISANLEVFGFTADASGPDMVGVGNEAEFDVTTSIGDSNVDTYIIDADGDGQGDASYDSAPFTHTFDSVGERDVTIDAVSGDNAVRNTLTVDVRETPSFDMTASSTTIESGQSVSFSADNVDVSNPAYEWDFDNGQTASSSTETQTFSSSGVYDVTLTVTDQDGISKTKTTTIEVEPKNALVAEWNFEQTFEDTSGNGHHLNSYGNPQFTTSYGPAGQHALELDGSEDYVTPGKKLLSTESDFSVSMWMRYDNGRGGVFQRKGDAPRTGFHFGKGDSSDYYYMSLQDADQDYLEVKTLVNRNSLSHYTVTYDKSEKTLSVYKDGELVGQDTNQAFDADTNRNQHNNLRIGLRETTHFDGTIDNVKIFDEEVGSSKVDELYSENIQENQVAHYTFEDASSSTVTDQAGTYDATLRNGASRTTDSKVGSYALNLDGNDDYAIIDEEISETSGASGATMSYWVKYDGFTDHGLSGYIKDDESNALRLGEEDGAYTFINAGTHTDVKQSQSFNTGQWYHLILSVEAGGEWTVYVNGNPIASGTEGVPNNLQSIPYFGIGATLENGVENSQYRHPTNGQIDDFRIYNAPITNSQAETIYNIDN